MSKCKICPLCGERNNPTSMECSECAADLMNVPITDPDVQKNLENEDVVSSSDAEAGIRNVAAPVAGQGNVSAGGLARICSSCGSINPPQLRKCQSCGEDISDILPSPVSQTTAVPASHTAQAVQIEVHYQLSEVNSGYVYNVPCGVMLVGREQGMRECLAQRPYVSRIHAKLIAQDGKLMVENLSTTNYTYVNNIKKPAGRTELHPGDELGLGGLRVNGVRQDKAAYFIVGLAP